MALVASLDLTSYLQAVSPPPARYRGAHSCSSSVSSLSHLLRTDHVTEFTRHPFDADRDRSFRSRDTARSRATTSDLAAADSGFSSDASKQTVPAASSSSSSSSSSRSNSARKRVSFADDVGLALTTVLHYEPPQSAPVDADPPPAQRPAAFRRLLHLDPAFRQPWLDPAGLRSRLEWNRVALESATGRGGGLQFGGTVLVLNVAFEKRVTLRCTYNGWRTFVDVDAEYVDRASCGDDMDLFSFHVKPPSDLTAERASARHGGARVQFAVRYQYRAHSDEVWTESWDNNDSRDYTMMMTMTAGLR